MSKRDGEALMRARLELDAIYDSIMALNLSVKPILVQQLRSVHAVVYDMEQKAFRPIIAYLLERGEIQPSECPPWYRHEAKVAPMPEPVLPEEQD